MAVLKTVTITKAAHLLSVSRDTIYQAIREGKLNAIDCDGKTRVLEDELTIISLKPQGLRTEERLSEAWQMTQGFRFKIHAGILRCLERFHSLDPIIYRFLSFCIPSDILGDTEHGPFILIAMRRGLPVELSMDDACKFFTVEYQMSDRIIDDRISKWVVRLKKEGSLNYVAPVGKYGPTLP